MSRCEGKAKSGRRCRNRVKSGTLCHVHKHQHQETDCTICLSNIGEDVYTLRCGHSFHPHCLHPWLRQNPTCPNCRKKIGLRTQRWMERLKDEDDDSEWLPEQRDMPSVDASWSRMGRRARRASAERSHERNLLLQHVASLYDRLIDIMH
ncbi:MAG: hypothetical protein CMD33_01305 [Flavobacteriales bacterium]|nr:hypothetical protein [Flavobacteriales bacterium]